MRLCTVGEIEDGMILGKSIYQNGTKLLLGAGYRITPDIQERLVEKGYSHVYILDEGTDDIIPEDVISDEVRHHAQSRLADNVKKVQNTIRFQDMSREKALELLENGSLKDVNVTYGIRKIIDEILAEISAIGAEYFNSVMIKSKDTAFFDHSLNTTVLSIIIGRQYRYSKSEIRSLALGSFLHDIGKIIIEQLAEPEKQSTKDLYREHPTFGYLLVKNDGMVTPMESQTINQHHENQDGTGFPIGLTGNNLPPLPTNGRETKGKIFRFAEICAVANAYDNLCLNPFTKEKIAPNDVIKQMIDGAGTIFNRDIIQTLTKIITVYPVGAYVKIVNIIDPSLVGSYGVVAKINRNDLSRPVIIITTNKYKKKVRPIMIDTSKLKLIQLELVI